MFLSIGIVMERLNFYPATFVIIVIHEFHGDTSLKQNFRAAVNVTY